jgi:hypothetical protein
MRKFLIGLSLADWAAAMPAVAQEKINLSIGTGKPYIGLSMADVG